MAANIVDVGEANFESEVVQYSKQKPVVVDFWAAWCQPCRVLGPMLERLTSESNDSFRLAKVDVDANNALAARFGVQGIPSVKGFRDGKLVAQFVGAQGEAAVRKFLADLVPSPADRMVQEAIHLGHTHCWDEAEKLARTAWDLAPLAGAAPLILMRAQLAQGNLEGARKTLSAFPQSKELSEAEKMGVLLDFISEAKTNQPSPADGFAAGYRQCGLLAARGDFPAVLDGLLDLLRQDKHYREDGARKVYLAILDVMGDADPLTHDYRDRLASVLF
jgi:putative thioredoxin